MSVGFKIREITEERLYGTEMVPVLGKDKKPKQDEKGRDVMEKQEVVNKVHYVRFTLEDPDDPTVKKRNGLLKAEIKVADSDTMDQIRGKAEAAIKASLK